MCGLQNLEWVVTVFEFLYGSFIHMWVLWLFSWSHSLYSHTEYYCCIVAIYDVRSSRIVSIRTGLKSRLIWDWSAIIHTTSASRSSLLYTCKMGRDLVRVAVYQSITIRRRMIRVGALMYGLWLAQNSPKTVQARQSRQNQVYLAFSSQKQVRCDAGQWPGSWHVICTCF